MPQARPLPTLLSQVLVAWTIEFDNEVEQRMSHRTTVGRVAGGGGNGPWLVSLVASGMRATHGRGSIELFAAAGRMGADEAW